ncbi:hypothetical protein ABH926_000919 [Catenulispora sp. GP43]|uniref:hypothetical protein n=1 Tax=Catenulispora sp. GP43 TaxID=3156263 RepID=UPI0035169E04
MSKKKQHRKAKPTPTANKQTKDQRPVPRHEQQLAVIGDTVLDIEAAFRLLRARPRRRSLFDPDHAATADLRRPLILITLTLKDGDEAQLIADGYVRPVSDLCRDLAVDASWMVIAGASKSRSGESPRCRVCCRSLLRGTALDFVDSWLEEMPFLISPSMEYDLDLNGYFLASAMVGAAPNTRLAAAGDLCRFLKIRPGGLGLSWALSLSVHSQLDPSVSRPLLSFDRLVYRIGLLRVWPWLREYRTVIVIREQGAAGR